MNKLVGGRGNKAPYETTHLRVPVPIKEVLQEIIEQWRDELISGKSNEVKLLTTLDEAKKRATKILKEKKSASHSLAKLLTAIYNEEVQVDDLK